MLMNNEKMTLLQSCRRYQDLVAAVRVIDRLLVYFE